MENWHRRSVKNTQYNSSIKNHKNVKKIMVQCFADVGEDLERTSDTKKLPYNRW